MGRNGLLIVVLLIVFTPLTGFAAGKLAVTVDSAPLISKITQVGKMTIANNTHNVYYDANVSKAVNDIRISRAKAYQIITELVNEYKSRYSANLTTGDPQEADEISKANIKFAIYNVEVTAQQTLQQIDGHIQKMTGLPSPTVSPSMSNFVTPRPSAIPTGSANFQRTTIPTQSLSTIYAGQQVAPTLTRAYANSGGQAFIPVVPSTSRIAYQLPGVVQSRPTFLQSVGIALGGYLGAQNFFAPQPKIKVNKMFSTDPNQYTVTLSAIKGASTTITVPDYLTASLVQDIKPGVYEVFYKTVGSSGAVLSATQSTTTPNTIARIGLGARFPLTVTNGQVWCLQVPMPPARCN